VTGSVSLWTDRDHLRHAYISMEPGPVVRELRRKYGRPLDSNGECCTPDKNGNVWGGATWVSGDLRVSVTYNAYSVDLVVEDASSS
jgi:hypothetical protein